MKSLALRHLALPVLLPMVFVGCAPRTGPVTSRPRNVILLIGDGMGPEQVKAASLFAHGADGKLFMQSLPKQATVATHPAAGPSVITDSAAAATAMATGRKVDGNVLSVALPGDGKPLKTALEYAQEAGQRTGLVTTTTVTNATPAAFTSHVSHRSQVAQIAEMIYQIRPNVLLGGGGAGQDPESARKAGYVTVTDRAGMASLDPASSPYVCGMFGRADLPYESLYAKGATRAYDTLPHLSEMAASALKLLEGSESGFFLMIEGGIIDHAGHANDLEASIMETLEFDRSVKVVMDWARGRDDTLVLVTADHETGGLTVVDSPGKGSLPTVTWSTKNHTGIRVPAFAWGTGSTQVTGDLDNTDIFAIITGKPKPSPRSATTLPAMATTGIP